MSKENNSFKPGIAGSIAHFFIQSKLTPVIAITSLLLGLGAVMLTPKEEEPQISVPMIDIQTEVPGLESSDVERQVTEPIERAVWGLDGVEYVYSSSSPHHSLVTVRFKVGEPMEPSLVKIHHKLLSTRDELPGSAGTSAVHSFSIDDVPFLTLTFSSATRDDFSLRSLVAPLARSLSSTPDLSKVELLGGRKRSIRVVVDPKRLIANGASLPSVAQALKENDAFLPVGKNWGTHDTYDVEVGGRIRSVEDVNSIAIGQRGGRVIKISDVASVVDGPEERVRESILFEHGKDSEPRNAVSISFSKRAGTNVVTLAKELLDHAALFSKSLPSDVTLSVVRDYGSTAAEKSKELIEHLLLATLSVSVLIAVFMGIRASLVVATAIPVTLALTLAIYYFMGYSLNRVTLFALIFSIGILVDDAIVVVENIERHLHLDRAQGLLKATLRAVSEVGNPTILATFTVIASILPMAFVRGLMGPYMKPIPVGASLAMILSLLVAFIVTPWASIRILRHDTQAGPSAPPKESRLDRLYRSTMDHLLGEKRNSILFALITTGLFVAAGSLVYFKIVKVKMLPFDNKNEFQVLVDFPPNTPLEENVRLAKDLAKSLADSPNVEKVQIFSGEPGPFSFSGMVKHTYLRRADSLTDLQIVLTEKGNRKESSHQIIESLRPQIKNFGEAHQATIKVLEIPPGPPVLSTMLAEVYGPDAETRNRVAKEIYQVFQTEKSVADLDYSWRKGRDREIYPYSSVQGGLSGTHALQAANLGELLFGENSLAILDDASAPEPVSITLSTAQNFRSSQKPFQDENLPTMDSGVTHASDVLRSPILKPTETLYRKNLKPVSYVMSELTGAEEAPVYGILKLAPQIKYPTQTAEVPWNTLTPVVKWDGEWYITYEVFRDLGGAFAVVMILIYILVLSWFKSFAVPLVIMAPIPISLIGILPGHALLGAYFTATSMIGFIAGAGIIVRNSIILVDFIEHQMKSGMNLKDAVINAGVLRFRPMLLTAAAVVVGGAVMLSDPIFQGLAISLMFGEVAATLLSRIAVPLLYYKFIGPSRVRFIEAEMEGESHVN